MKKKLDSFTIAEMLVVLVISAIIVTLSFTVLNLVQIRFQKLQFNLEQRSENTLITGRLRRDLNYNNQINLGNDNSVKFKTPLDSVLYKFEEAFVIIGVDTLGRNIKEVRFFYKGEPVSEGEIDAIKIKTGLHEEIYFISRRNSVEEKFRAYED